MEKQVLLASRRTHELQSRVGDFESGWQVLSLCAGISGMIGSTERGADSGEDSI